MSQDVTRRNGQAGADPLLGRCIGGEFDVFRLIATGGIGAVYEAQQRSTSKPRALKVMHPWLLRDERMRERFIDEARLAGTIESDHVVEVVSAGIDAELDVPWIAMELLRGETLADHVERLGPVTPEACAEMLTQARHGLQYAHERRLVHRDLKPENVFVAEPRRLGVPFTIKLLDFGIAKWAHEARDGDKSSQVIGTPSWMAPEQLVSLSTISPATDTWALGLLAFYVLSGREYWLAANDVRGTIPAVLLELAGGAAEPASIRAVRLGSPARLPAGFDAWFAKSLAPRAEARFPDAASSIDALVPLLTSASSASRSLPPAPPRVDESVPPRGAPLDSAVTRARTLTARRLTEGEIENELFAGSEETRAFFPVARWLARGLWSGSTPTQALGTARETSLRFPDAVHEAVRHVSFVLGVHPAPKLVLSSDPAATSFTIESLDPPAIAIPERLVVPHLLGDEPFLALLRARAAIAIARTLPWLAIVGIVDSAEQLDTARKAAVVLTRGSVTTSPYFRRLVSRLGERREELARACAEAEGVPTEAFWTAALQTIARLAYVCAGNEEAAITALAAEPWAPSEHEIAEELQRFSRSPSFDGYWHRPR